MNKKEYRRWSLNASLLWGPSLKSSSSGSWLPSPDFRSRIQLAGVVLFFALTPVGVVEAGSFQPRVRIPEVAQVEGETVKLSDLLPPDAPTELGEMCSRIVLGNTPLPASPRLISKGQIEQQLREFPSILEQLELPERLIVTCKRRRLSTAEILAAIETFREGEGLRGARAASLSGLSLQAPVFVTKADAGVEVRRVESDRVQRKTRFLLWTSKEPQVLPFYVTVEELPERAGRTSSHNEPTGESPTPTDSNFECRSATGDLTDSPGLVGGSPPRVTAHKGESTQQAMASRVVLVVAGRPARLVVEMATLRMTALVTPLQSGVKGQTIRVRNLDTQRAFEAEVVGPDLLQAEVAGE
jgi:hypothetical protein